MPKAKKPCFKEALYKPSLVDILEFRIALHGDTAINLFFRNAPRLSVDIDLTYLLIDERTNS
jgi:hypothetical protein